VDAEGEDVRKGSGVVAMVEVRVRITPFSLLVNTFADEVVVG
jgi:hypothetical protein